MAIETRSYPLRVSSVTYDPTMDPPDEMVYFASAPSPLSLNAGGPSRIGATQLLDKLVKDLVFHQNIGVPYPPPPNEVEIQICLEGSPVFVPVSNFYDYGLPDGLHQISLQMIT